MADKAGELPNIKVLRAFRGPEGVHVPEGTIFPKAAMDKSDWSTLVNMTPPRAIETSDKVRKVKEEEEAEPALPGA